jgi:hypothetical protein
MRNFVGILMLLACVASHAFIVDLDDHDGTARAIGISNLDIQGTAYDVIFEHSVGPHNNRQPGDIFIDEASATAATDAINAALNSIGGIAGVGVTNDNRFIVPWEFDTTSCGSQGDPGTCGWEGRSFGGSWNGLFKELDSTNGNVPVEFARFSATVVPVPAAAWLFGSALGILVWVRKRSAITRTVEI